MKQKIVFVDLDELVYDIIQHLKFIEKFLEKDVHNSSVVVSEHIDDTNKRLKVLEAHNEKK